MKSIFFSGALALLIFFGCEPQGPVLTPGAWHGKLQVMDGEHLPFNFSILPDEGGLKMEIYNAEEVIVTDPLEIKGDSIVIRMPVFEGYLSGTYTAEEIRGAFIKESLDRVVPFSANYGDHPRFKAGRATGELISGTWETVFTDGDKTYPAKGMFKQDGEKVTGTFRTTTGDYRYLEGVVRGDTLKLSTFDGAHAFLFTAKVFKDSLSGMFYSGNHSKESFTAIRNPDYELPDENALTFLKDGYESLAFSFPDENGTMVSLDDERFKDKVVIVQLMGTWCPNCLDESRFLSEYLNDNPNEELEVIALAFEYAQTPEAAFRGINRLRTRLGLDYPILLAQYGTSSKLEANKKLPMLNHVLSYPTTVFIDKKGTVRKIHTGFNGPATGDKYTTFKKEFKETVMVLLAE